MFDPTKYSHTHLTPQNHHNHHHHQRYGRSFYLDNMNQHHQEPLQFRPTTPPPDDDSGVCSPPLWKTPASPSPTRSPSHPLLGPNNTYRSLSPNSRAQAIARGQMELMEMVKNMPESSYELSLKDIVEHQRVVDHHSPLRASPISFHHRGGVVRRNNFEHEGVNANVNSKNTNSSKGNKNGVMRNGSFEIQTRGFFLNMFFPVSLKAKKNGSRDNRDTNKSGGGNMSGSTGSSNGEKDWWKKKKFTASSDSESSKVSSNSTGSSGSTGDSGSGGSGRSYGGRRRKKEGLLRGCWPFFESRSSKSV